MIRDLLNNPIINAQLDVQSSSSKTFKIIVDCVTGNKLTCTANADVTVEARKQGDSTWIDLQSDEIDLGIYNGTSVIFEVKVTSDIVTQFQTTQFTLNVSV